MKKSRAVTTTRPKKRRPIEKRLEDVGHRIEDRFSGVADRAMDVVEANLDRWMDSAVEKVLERVGLAPPDKITIKGEGGKLIELVKKPDGSYGIP